MRRPERLAETLREEIIEIVGYELEDPRIQSVTVTDVVVSDNLRDAKVFVLVEGDEGEIKDAITALQHAATYVRQQVALNLNLNHAPRLHFARDTVEEKAARVENILEKLEINKEENS
ncbi:MAG TPA: 30S ribosome-binding factor RbfA [Pyrinomonadaceae bacterium]|nr:30S ribosome-binding factor RbfA [Pyrinomonadaceae bacterium]